MICSDLETLKDVVKKSKDNETILYKYREPKQVAMPQDNKEERTIIKPIKSVQSLFASTYSVISTLNIFKTNENKDNDNKDKDVEINPYAVNKPKTDFGSYDDVIDAVRIKIRYNREMDKYLRGRDATCLVSKTTLYLGIVSGLGAFVSSMTVYSECPEVLHYVNNTYCNKTCADTYWQIDKEYITECSDSEVFVIKTLLETLLPTTALSLLISLCSFINNKGSQRLYNLADSTRFFLISDKSNNMRDRIDELDKVIESKAEMMRLKPSLQPNQ